MQGTPQNQHESRNMGLAWYIAAETDVDGLDIFCNGKSIAHADEARLESLCLELGVRPLMDFFSVDPVETAMLLEAYLGEDADEPLDTPDEEWFHPEEGLKTVKALREYLAAHPNELEGQQAVVDDLNEYQHILEVLQRNQVRWHMAVDI
ncbi:MAG: hypothetical protein CVV07_06300 [Gammaproteobacteria bacterium HGW-Gammaproteobacteria-11]|nr:MAG: hypothetical protein CVV07_06300 [Gammaproteobacteria bacterium HGW-Gammaproteobacteria-11]